MPSAGTAGFESVAVLASTVTSEIGPIGFGTYRLTDHDRCVAAVETALDAGYRHVDTAQMYDNESFVGEGLAASPVDRGDVFVATKLDTDNCGGDDVPRTARESLDRLGLDAVDLLYVHWPLSTYDPTETLPAMAELYDEGLVRNVGLSNFEPDQLRTALDHLDDLGVSLHAHQVEMHPMLAQRDLRAIADREGHRLVAYSPIARGAVADVPVIREIAEKHDATPAQVSLAWVAESGAVPIPKSGTPAHIRENVAALALDLDDEDVAAIDHLDRRERVVDFAAAPWNQQ